MNADLILATHNPGKLREIRTLLMESGLRAHPATDFVVEEPEETGQTFEANARLKATVTARAAGVVALADDSGVCVDALDGEPGIHTARWAGEPRDFAIARRRVRESLDQKGVSDARTTWVTVLALAWPDGRWVVERGEARGTLVWPERVRGGFGFEPVFLPDGFAITYSEMTDDLKRRVNARAAAFRRILPEIAGLRVARR